MVSRYRNEKLNLALHVEHEIARRISAADAIANSSILCDRCQIDCTCSSAIARAKK
jgi:hypothetical protein